MQWSQKHTLVILLGDSNSIDKGRENGKRMFQGFTTQTSREKTIWGATSILTKGEGRVHGLYLIVPKNRSLDCNFLVGWLLELQKGEERSLKDFG